MASDARERILAALRHLLNSGGLPAVTLEAVAAQAGVSKGGLLYHFPSKSHLLLGLLEQIRDTVVVDMDRQSAAVGGAQAYLQYAIPTDDEGFFTSLIAAVRTGTGPDAGSDTGPDTGSLPETEDRAARLLVEIFTAWEAPMRAEIGDPVQAELIKLVGNGIYLSAIAGLPLPDSDLLAAVFDRVLAR